MVVVRAGVDWDVIGNIQEWWDDWMKSREKGKKLDEDINIELIKHGEGLFETWVGLAFQDPPEDFLGRVIWTIGLWGQMTLSIATFPAALAAFLLEESVQTYGMGAYMLFTGKQWELLDTYLVGQKAFIDASKVGAKTLAGLSPVTGGAVLLYLDAAMDSWGAFKARAEIELVKALEAEENRKLLEAEATLYGTLNIRSSPSGAEIWINGEYMDLLTPETFKRLDVGPYVITLNKYNKTREVTDSYTFEVDVEPGRKKEIMIHIPEAVTSEEEWEEEASTGDLSIKSTPSSAEIWLFGEDSKLLTPESFKDLRVGKWDIRLRAFSRTLAVWDEYEFSVVVEKNRKTEVKVNIPGKAFDEIKERLDIVEVDSPKLDDFVKAIVTGDYAVDGDTFQTTAGERIRILGIDTPELGRPWADMAKEETQSLIEDKKITLRIQTFLPIDKYGRTLAICESYKGNIAILLLSAGLARAFIADDATYDPARYLEAERIAKERRIGIWSEMP